MKTIVVYLVAIVLAIGGILSIYPMSLSLAQTDNATTVNNSSLSEAESNATAGTNTTSSQENSTFTASGSLAGLIFGEAPVSVNSTSGFVGNVTATRLNETGAAATSEEPSASTPYVIAGDWDLGVADGNLTGFDAEFTMVHTYGTGRHTHQLMNFEAANGTLVQLDENGSGVVFGTVDVSLNGSEQWSDASVAIMIERSNAIAISLDSNATENHFNGQPIYGTVDSWVDVNGRELIDDAREAGATTGQTISDAGENITDSAEQVGNQTGQAVENVTNATGNIIDDLGERVTDLFNGTDN